MKSITKQELKGWINAEKEFQLIDVRETWEHEAYNIGGVSMPMGDLMNRKAEIRRDIDVVIYCEKGIRSTIAIQRLESLGYNGLINLQGGMTAWRRDETI